MKNIANYISKYDLYNNIKEMEEEIEKFKNCIDNVELSSEVLKRAKNDAKNLKIELNNYIRYLKYSRFFYDINEDYKKYTSNELKHLSIEKNDLYKTKELIKLSKYELLPVKSETGIVLKNNNKYYFAFNEYINPQEYNYIIKILMMHYESSYIRIAKNLNCTNQPKIYLTKGAETPLLWKYDKKFKKNRTFSGSYSSAYQNKDILYTDYTRRWGKFNLDDPNTEYKTEISISSYDRLEILVEELHNTEDGVIGKCIHATICNSSEQLEKTCEHIDLSINLYSKTSNRLNLGINSKVEADKRIHFFRINDTFQVSEIPEMLINIFKVKTNIYEILYELDNLEC